MQVSCEPAASPMSASHARSWQYPLSVFGGFFALWVLVMTSPAYAPHQSHLFVPSQALHPTRSLPAAPHVPSLSHKEAARSSSRLLGPNPSESQPAATRQSALHGPDSAAHAAPAYQPQSLWVGNALVACGFLGFATYVSRRRRLRASGLPQESTPCLGPDCRPPLALRANPDKALVVDPEAELETGTTTSEPTSPTQTPPGSPSPEATRYPKERLFIFNPPKGSTKGFTKGSAKASTPTSRAQELQERIYAFSPQEALEHPPDAPPPSRRADILGKIAAYGFTALSVVALALNLQWHPHLYGLYLVGWVAAATTIFHNRSAYTRRISPELLCFLATSVWASLGFAAGIPVEVDLAFDYFLPGSLALSLLLQAPAPKAPEKPNPKPPKPSKAKPVGLVSSRVKKLKPTPPAKKEGNRLTPMFAALCFGAVGTISGSLLTAFGMQFLGLNVPGHLVALSMGCLTASYIGGTANFFETVRMINPDPEGLQYVTVLAGGDVAVMGLYFFVLRLIHQFSPETYVHHDTQGKEHIVATNPRTVHDVALLLGAGLTGLCLAGLAQVFAHLIPLTSVPLVLMIFTAYATGAVLQRTLWAAWKARVFNAVEAAAEMMMNMFFATLGASATIQELQRLGATAIGSMSCVLAVHLGILMAGRYVYNRCAANRMDTDTMLVASNACAGGAATAASMAESIKRPDLTIPAITVGLVGYVAGTRIGLVMYKFLLGVL